MAFSAMHSARLSGRKKLNSAGHSVPGVFWNTMRTPSRTSSWPVWLMMTVGAMRSTVPVETLAPSPMPSVPVGPFSRVGAP